MGGAALGKPPMGTEARWEGLVVFLEELTQQGRSWPGGCGRRWTTDSVFGPP